MKSKKINVGDITKMSNLKNGNIAEIVGVCCKNLLVQKRLFEMGVIVGTKVQIKKIAPLGDPVVIGIRNYELCLRKNELKNIDVRILK